MVKLNNELTKIATGQVQKANNGSTPSSTSDLQIKQAITSGKRISVAEISELDQMFRTIFMLVGLRPQYQPNQLEALFLYDFVRESYGMHTMEEVVLAFKKVARGELLEKDGRPIELYDYFTPIFFGKVMSLYRAIASEVGNKLADEQYQEQLKQLDYQKPVPEINWRAVIEQDYQAFLLNPEATAVYPEAHYNTLVEDGLIAADLWQKKLPSVKTNLLRDLNHQLTLAQNANLEKTENYQHWNRVKAEIEHYKSPDAETELQVLAKQQVVRSYFRFNRDSGTQNIYVPHDAADTAL